MHPSSHGTHQGDSPIPAILFSKSGVMVSTAAVILFFKSGLWWHKHFVFHVTPKEVVTRGLIGVT